MSCSGNSEQPSEKSEFDSGSRRRGSGSMYSVATAQDLTKKCGGLLTPSTNWKDQISAVHRALTSEHRKWKFRDLCWSKVKTWYYAEARRVDYHYVEALKELRAEEELKGARRQFAASAIILASHYAEIGSTVDRDALLEVGRRHGAMDLPRDGRDAR